MPRITSFNYYSHEELLGHFTDKRDASEVIEELCQRIEELMSQVPEDFGEDEKDKVTTAGCPVCLAELKVSYDGDTYTLEE